MNNAVATMNIPAHLAVLAGGTALASITAAAAAGISSGAFPRISIRGKLWRLIDAQGAEVIATQVMQNPTTGETQQIPQHWLDVLIIDANPNMSKIYYEKGYDPDDAIAPTCYSDNGIAPSARAEKPQCGTCAACPHNVWGSKITPAGAQTKACTDAKKLAVILADNPTGAVYELRVPAASMKGLLTFVQGLVNRKIELPMVKVRLQFDPQSEFPKIVFAPLDWATPEQVAAIQDVLGTDEAAIVTGKNDRPMDSSRMIAGPAAQPAAATPPVAPQPAVGTFAQPAAPAAGAFAQQSPSLAAGAFTQQPPAAPVAEAPKKRTRKATGAPPVVAAASSAPAFNPPGAGVTQPVNPSGFAMPPAAGPVAAATPETPAFLRSAQPAQHMVDAPNSASAAASAPISAGVTNANLDDLIANALKV